MSNTKKVKEDYKTTNKDKIKENKIEYYKKNKDNIQEYYVLNKDKRKEYRIKNQDKITESERKYKLKNREKARDFRIQKDPNYIPYDSWKTREQSRKSLESIASLLHIKDLSDWYRVSLNQIKHLGGGRVIDKFGSLCNALQYIYPEYSWDLSKFSFKGKKSTQRWLYFKLKELLPNVDIIEDFNHPDLAWEKIKYPIQLDIWVPEYNLALEYQGEHHYYDLHTAYGTGSTSKMFFERDQEKKNMCLDKGITLVCIPYWWNGKTNSLSSTLHQTYPTLFPKTDSPPIPTSPAQESIN